MKKHFNLFKSVMYSLVLTALAVVLGDANGVALAVNAVGNTEGMGADGDNLTDPGKSYNGNGNQFQNNDNGVQTQDGKGAQTYTGANDADGDFLDKDIDRKITKIRPMSTPIDQISRMADSSSCTQMDFKYFSIGTRPIKTTLATAFTAQTASTTTTQIAIDVTNPDIFTLDDTIRVVGVKAVTDYKGNAYGTGDNVPDLILKVCGFDATTGQPVVYAINGILPTGGQYPILIPAIAQGKTLVRMGKACGELDMQTGRFANIPESEVQYCQNFMMQIEESTFYNMAEKNVDWNFSDMEEDSVYDMRLGMEGSFLFGDRAKIKHKSKENMYTWFTGGIWWMAGKDIIVGEYDAQKKCAVISDDNLVDIAKDLFVGTGAGTKRKVMFCGSDMLAALSKIDSEKFRLKDTVEVWDLKFKSWDTDFGEILTMHHEFFDLNGMSDCALAIDPEYLSKRKFLNWTRTVLDLKAAGIRNTNAVVLQEASALYLRYPKAHARMQLAQASTSAS